MKHGQKKHIGCILISLQVEISTNNLLIKNLPALISIMPLNQHFLLSVLDFSPHKRPPFIIIINKLWKMKMCPEYKVCNDRVKACIQSFYKNHCQFSSHSMFHVASLPSVYAHHKYQIITKFSLKSYKQHSKLYGWLKPEANSLSPCPT